MYSTRSSRGDNLGIGASLDSSDLKVSDILVPSYMNEETRRQRLKDNLNKMWHKSLEEAQRNDTGTNSVKNNTSRYVSKTAELQERRSRRRNLDTINYLETLKRRQIMGNLKNNPASHNEYYEAKIPRRTVTAQQTSYSSPLKNFMPRSQNTRVLIDKILPSSRSYKRQELQKEIFKKRQSDYEFAEIEDSIISILKKGDRRPQTSAILTNDNRKTMVLGPSHFDRPVAVGYVTTTGTSMFEPAPAQLRLDKRTVQKRHKFVQSNSLFLTNSGSQTDPFEPVIVFKEVESKQTGKVDVSQTKSIEKISVPFDTSNNQISMDLIMDNLSVGEGEGTATDLSPQPTTVVKIIEEVKDKNEKKTKKQDSGTRLTTDGLPRLGPSTPADAILSRPGTKGFKSNFSDMLKKRNTTSDLYDGAQEPTLTEEEEIAEPVVVAAVARPKSSAVIKAKVRAPSPVEIEDANVAVTQIEEESDEDEEESAPVVVNRARTAPADIAPPKSILKKRPEFNRQISYNSDGTGTPGYAKAFHKTKDFHIDPTLFRHFGKANNTRKLSFAGATKCKSSKSSKGKTTSTTSYPNNEVSYFEEEEPESIAYYDQQTGYNDQQTGYDDQQTGYDDYNDQLHQHQYQHYQSQQSQPYHHDPYPQNQWHQYNYNYGYYDPYMQQPQYQQIPNYTYSYPLTTSNTNPYPYYATNSDSQLMNNQGYYEQPIQENYTLTSNEKPTKPRQKKSTTTFKPNITMQKKERIPVVKTFYVPPKKPPTPQYIPLSQTQPEDIVKQEKLFRPKLKLKSHVSDTAIRVHAKDTLSRNPRGKLRQLYANSGNDMQRLPNEDPLY